MSESAAATESDVPVVAARDLAVTFTGRGSRGIARAVDGVQLSLHRGEIVALVGESGCGKTTLARSLLGLERPSAGEVLVDGQPLAYGSKDLTAYRKRVQLVLQDPTGALNPRHSVYEAVAEGLRIHGYPGDEREKVADALSRAGLRPPERFFLRYPHELSGGQRQRVAIARVLLKDAPILILDEATSALDSEVEAAIQDQLDNLMKGKTVIAIAHRLSTIAAMDRLIIMDKGQVVETGTHDTLIRRGGLYANLWARQSGGFLAKEAAE